MVFTGGAANGSLWAQILADVLNVPVRVPHIKESTALGAAICAGVGVGLYSSLTEGTRLARFDAEIAPNAVSAATYDRLYDQWREVYGRMLQISDEGIVRPLWRAAGT